MALLTVGKPLSHEDLVAICDYIRSHGVDQFLNTWRRVKDICDDDLRFGDEIECGVFVIDKTEKTVKLSIRSIEIREVLDHRERENSCDFEGCTWHPEFGGWMVESTPSRPYSNFVTDLLRVERNMVLRRKRLLSVLKDNEIAPTVTCFPLLGVGDFIANPLPFSAPSSLSNLVPDYAINTHPRFAALTENIRERRGSQVDIQVPLYQDVNTPEFKEDRSKWLEMDQNIHMDCMAFGMGMCCLQVTFQARDVDESRYMYDQLAVLAPIMLALTAATPIFKGRLSDIDVRWTVIAQSVDDRTPAERGLIPKEDLDNARREGLAGAGIRQIPKSRYDSISTYIYHCKGDPACNRTFDIYNDIPCPVDESLKNRLREHGVDENLAHHIAHLFIRDPLVVYYDNIELDDTTSVEHFENIQSTNWNTCRWKPPPPRESPDDPHIGWRTEFRPMEVQFTDFENAAFTVFIVLVTRVLLAFDLAFYIPLSKVDENMSRAHEIDAARTQKFYFRKYVAPPEEHVDENVSEGLSSPSKCHGGCCLPAEDSYEEMSMDEIFNGKNDYFPGLIPLVYAYLDFINCDSETFKRVDQYIKFISKRASGELITPSTWIRQFVQKHPSYQQDSVISSEIAYDLMMACKGIGEGHVSCPEMLGDVTIDRILPSEAYRQVLPGRLDSIQRNQLLQRLKNRGYHHRSDNVPRGRSQSCSFLHEHSS